jgi:hypothetical protein
VADISSLPFINYGLSQAQQAQAGASANLENQQAAGAAMQNQIMAAKLPMMLEAFKGAEGHITDFSGQHDGNDVPSAQYDPASDDSGMAPPGANRNIRVSPLDLIGRDANHTNTVQGALQGMYNVDPSGTPQEQGKIRAAYMYQQRINLLGDKGLSDSAASALDAAKYERDMGVKDRTNKANLDASQRFETLSNVNSAPHPFQQLQASGPEGAAAAARIKSTNPNADEETLDELARSATGQAAGFLHRFTGRPTETDKANNVRDKDTQQIIPGVTPAGFDPAEIEKIREEALKPSTRKVNGRDVTQENFRWAHFDTPEAYVAKAIAQGRATQASQSRVESQRQGAVAIQAHAGVPPDQRIPAPGAKQPASQTVDQNNTTAAQGAAATHQISKPPGAPPPARTVVPPPKSPTAQPSDRLPASTNSPTGKLDLSDIQKSDTPNNGLAGLPHNASPSDKDNAYWGELRKKNAEMGETSQGSDTAIQIARNAQNALAKDAATGGSAATRTWMATALGNPESLRFMLGDATSSAILRKMLGNASFAQIEADANGNQMRLGANTIKVAMTQLSASPEMTPEAIRQLTGQMIKNAGYEKQKSGTDYAAYRSAGGDVTDYDRWYRTKYPNKSQIDMGNERGPTITSQKDYDALNPGDPYLDADGKQHHKGGRK